MKTRNKLIIAFSALGVLAVAAVVALVAVLAAQTQTVSSTISVTYQAVDVSASVSGKYKVGSAADWTTNPGEGWTALTGGTNGVITFEPTDNQTTGTLTADTINFTSANNIVNFVYSFTNNGDNAISVTLSTINYPQDTAAAYITVLTKNENNTTETPVTPTTATTFNVAAGTTATIELVFTLNNLAQNLPANSELAIGWTLANINA